MIDLNEVQKLIELSEKELKDDAEDSGIFTGYSGLALFFFEKSKLHNDEDSISKLEYYLNKSIESLDKNKNFSLCSGNIGVYYLILYLINSKYIDEKIEDYFEDFPEYAEELTTYYSKDNNFDYLHGFLGVLFLCVELYSCTENNSFKSKIEKVIVNIVHKLDSLSVNVDKHKIAWISKGQYSKVEGFSFGLAHGIPSILSLLTRVYILEIEKDKIKKILRNAYNYIISVKGNYNGACFPNFIVKNNTVELATDSSRLAWCYGDISVGISLLNYGIAIKDIDIIKEANVILLATTKRDYSSTGINDVFLCHGTSGLAMMYNYLYRKTNIEDYKIKTEFWINDTIYLSNLEKPNIKTWLGSEGWIDQDSILEGKSGLILTLYTFIHKNYSNPLEKLFLLDYEDRIYK